MVYLVVYMGHGPWPMAHVHHGYTTTPMLLAGPGTAAPRLGPVQEWPWGSGGADVLGDGPLRALTGPYWALTMAILDPQQGPRTGPDT